MAALRYTRLAIALHWAMAVLILGLFGLGLYMHELPLSPEKLQYYAWHKWAGVCVFLLAALRLAWRLGHRPPPLPGHMSGVERALAQAGHGLLYGLMFAVPLSGWLMSSAKGFQTVLFGVWPLPDLLARNPALGDLLQTAHWGLNMTLAALVLGHAGAALKHHFINRDDVLARMSPRRVLRSDREPS